MKYLPILLLFVLFCANSALGQNESKKPAQDIFLVPASLKCRSAEIPDRILFEKFEKDIAAAPKNHRLYFERAKCYRQIEDFDAVLKDISAILNLLPAVESYFAFDLTDLFWSRLHDERKARIDYLIVNNPKHFFPLQMRAMDKISVEDYKGAYEDYLKAAEISPLNSVDRFGVLGSCLHKGLKDDKNIIEYYNRAFSLYENILEDFELQIERNEDSWMTVSRMRGVNLQIGNVLQAWSVALADIYFERGDIEKSNAALEKLVRIPPVPLAYRFRSSYYKRKGNLQKAEEDRIKSIEANVDDLSKQVEDKNLEAPRKAGAYISRGDTYLELKQYDKAIADYETAKTITKTVATEADAKIESARQKMAQENNPPK